MQVDSAGRDLDLRVWAHQRVVQRRRARRLARLNAVLVPVTCLVCWLLAVEVWRVFR